MNHDGRLLKAADAAQLSTAAGVLQSARERAAAMIEEAGHTAAALREKAVREGWLEGRNAAAKRHVETVAGALKYFDQIETSFADLLAESVRALLATMPPEEQIRQLAAKAMEGLRQQSKLTFRVNPADLQGSGPVLAELRCLLPPGAEVHVTSSDEVPPGGVFLESPLGIIDASLETQLENLKNALRATKP
jgi:type III secretion protein L